MALYHSKTNTIADWTGTVTVGNSTGGTQTAAASNLVLPSDWNSVHVQALTLSGNTSGQSTVSGTDIVLAGGQGINLSAATAAGVATVSIGLNDILTGFPLIVPASTGSFTRGAIGVSTGSVFCYPFWLPGYVAFNAIRMLETKSVVTTTVAATATISSYWGLYSLNGETLSLISSLSLGSSLTLSSGSATISFASQTSASGYAYVSTTRNVTGALQSDFGSVNPRLVDLVLGASSIARPGFLWLGLLQRQSTSGGAVGISSGNYANVIATQLTNVLPNGISATNTTDYKNKIPGFGVYTVTQTALPSAIPLTQIAHSITQFPLLSLTST